MAADSATLCVMTLARRLWEAVETIHAVTYFAEDSRREAAALGLRGFWRMYFAFRAAPMGRAAPAVVEASFFGFAPGMVRRAVPDVWDTVPPNVCLEARSRAAAAALRRLVPGVDALATDAAVSDTCRLPFRPGSGLPLYSANRDVPEPDDPVARLWQRTTLIREHRGDVHNALWAARGMMGAQVLVLVSAQHGHRDQLQPNRGWSDSEWADAEGTLESRSLLAGGRPTASGRELIAEVESATDAVAAEAMSHLSPAGIARLVGVLTPAARAVSASGVLPYPNPIGLEPVQLGP